MHDGIAFFLLLFIGTVRPRKKYLPRFMGTTEVVIYKSNNSHFASKIRTMVGLFAFQCQSNAYTPIYLQLFMHNYHL